MIATALSGKSHSFHAFFTSRPLPRSRVAGKLRANKLLPYSAPIELEIVK